MPRKSSMKEFVVHNLFFLCLCSASFAGANKQVMMGTRDYALAVRYGAKAKATFRVIDEVGNVVTGANIQVSFARPDSKWIKGITDTNGLFKVEGKSSGEMLYSVNKEGYYQTDSKHKFGEGNVRLEDGRWIPWNATNTVMLKRILSPVAMCASDKEIRIPMKGTNVAFDLEKYDWVAPYGKGEQADLIVNCDSQFTDPWTGFRRLELTFGTNSLDGVRRYTADEFSAYRSIYEAPEDGYEKSITWSIEISRKKKDIIKEPLPDEYFVFRVRTEVDDNGNIVKANYGKIYGPVQYGSFGGRLLISMIYYFNPEVNSRNLEFDRKKNLLGSRIFTP